MNRKSFFRIGMMAGIVSMIAIGCTQDDPNEISLPRDKFIGTWTMESHHSDPNQAAVQHWDLIIDAASSESLVALKNFDNTGNVTIYANVNGNNLTIPETSVDPDIGDERTIKGTGNMNGDVLSFTYTSVEAQVTDSATAVSH